MAADCTREVTIEVRLLILRQMYSYRLYERSTAADFTIDVQLLIL